MTKIQREAISACQRNGATVTGMRHGGKHWIVQCIEGRFVFPSSPSDQRWIKNFEAQVRRMMRDRAND